MKVSVVVPAYNEEKYIDRCLRSLFSQEEEPDEIIMVDNNSQGRTVSIARKFGVRIVHEKTQGIIPARNRGFEEARHALIGPNMAITKAIWDKIKERVCLDERSIHEDIDLEIHVNELGGKIHHDHSMVVQISGRRIKSNPASFLIEYPYRVVKTIIKHK